MINLLLLTSTVALRSISGRNNSLNGKNASFIIIYANSMCFEFSRFKDFKLTITSDDASFLTGREKKGFLVLYYHFCHFVAFGGPMIYYRLNLGIRSINICRDRHRTTPANYVRSGTAGPTTSRSWQSRRTGRLTRLSSCCVPSVRRRRRRRSRN